MFKRKIDSFFTERQSLLLFLSLKLLKSTIELYCRFTFIFKKKLQILNHLGVFSIGMFKF